MEEGCTYSDGRLSFHDVHVHGSGYSPGLPLTGACLAFTDGLNLDLDSAARSLSFALEPGDCGVWTLPCHPVLCLRQARCTTYGAQMATRVLTAFLISSPIGSGSGMVNELCQPEKRAQKLGWWTLMTTIGTPFGPFLMGFVIQRVVWQWIFWVYAIVNFCQFLLYLAIGDETLDYL